MKRHITLFVIFFSFLAFSCKKSSNNQFNVKFEVVSSSPITNPTTTILIKTGLASSETFTNFTSGSSLWSKVYLLETAYRPIDLLFNVSTFYVATNSTATFNIYVNDVLQSTKTVSSTTSGGQIMIAPTAINYTIN